MSPVGDPEADLIRIFRDEAGEHLDGVVDCLLAVEAGRASAETTDALFRHVHSIKGSAGMVGLQEAGTIAGAIEDVLERARAEGALSPELTEPLLRATDALRRAAGGEQGIAEAAVEALVDESSADDRPAVDALTSQSRAGEQDESGEDRGRAAPEMQDGGPQTTVGSTSGAGRATSDMPRAQAQTRSIRVAAGKVDRLLDSVNETVLHRRRLEHVLSKSSQSHAEEGLEREVDRGERLLEELQDAALDLRTVPLSSITGPLPRVVRDLASAEGKQADLEIVGAETQLDRLLLDGMSELIVHLLRNALAHGIEPPQEREQAGKPRRGQLRLQARQHGGQVAIDVLDDGRGVPAAALAEAERGGSLVDVVAAPGFSTAQGVSDIAGRGVGLDAVKRQVESVGGSLAIDTEPGAGTRITLLLPTTLTLLRVLIVQRAGQRFGVPLTSIAETVAVEQMMMLGGRPQVQVREDCLRLSDLALILGLSAPELPDVPYALVVRATSGRLAVACDRVIDEQEVIVKPLGPLLAGVQGYLGATILGDGTVMLILDPAHLVRQAPSAAAAVRVNAAAARQAREAPQVLVVDDQFTVRELQRSILRAAGYRVQVASDGREALDALSASNEFDIVVTDLQMPEMDGLALLGAIRADPDRSSLPVIVVTSRGSEDDRRRGAEAGADAYIVKDEFDQRALLETIERLVGTR
jgi:two-component system chemotaxis sensor kinase CheA